MFPPCGILGRVLPRSARLSWVKMGVPENGLYAPNGHFSEKNNDKPI
jgi:hypothetical protein